jgi:hypothetical protein
MTAIASENRGHDGLRDISWWFSSFILMQENVSKSTSIPLIIFVKENDHKPSGIPRIYFRKEKRP